MQYCTVCKDCKYRPVVNVESIAADPYDCYFLADGPGEAVQGDPECIFPMAGGDGTAAAADAGADTVSWRSFCAADDAAAETRATAMTHVCSCAVAPLELWSRATRRATELENEDICAAILMALLVTHLCTCTVLLDLTGLFERLCSLDGRLNRSFSFSRKLYDYVHLILCSATFERVHQSTFTSGVYLRYLMNSIELYEY